MRQRISEDPSKYGGFQIRENDCSYVWEIAAAERCDWVKSQINCESDSSLQYTQLLFCTFTSETGTGGLFALGLFLFGCWLLYLFLILGTTADNFFCPSLGVIANVMHLSENIAGVTILAFGNGAPDIFTSLVATDQREMVIMFTELIGAGIFVTAIIAGSVALVDDAFRIPVKSFTRDSCFYIFAVCWISYTSQDQVIHLWEALSLILIYIFFIVIVVAMQFYENREEQRKARIPRLQDPEVLRTFVAAHHHHRGTTIPPRPQLRPDHQLPLRSRAYSLRAKLDVAIATEMARIAAATRNAADAPSLGNVRTIASSSSTTTTAFANNDNDPPYSSPRPTGLLAEFFYDINPISYQDWRRSNPVLKSILVIRAPVTLLLQLLIPVVNETAEKRGWSKLLNCLQLCITPILFLFKLDLWRTRIFGNSRMEDVPILLIIVSILSVSVGSVVFIKTDAHRCPKYHNAFAFIGFAATMLVVYVIANEIMAVLQCIGYASGVSDPMLGITLLAWGNSVGDLISNVAIARRGFNRMGYSACFGGPLFNTLLGLGLSWTIAAAKNHDYYIKIRTSDMMPGCLAFLLASLGASLIYLNAVGFVARRSYAFLLYSLYFVFVIINILSELHIIHPLGTDHRDD